MAGLASLLGIPSNPFLDFTGRNRSALMGLGAGIASGPNWSQGLSQGLNNMAQMSPMDAQRAEQERLLAEQTEQKNQTVQWLAEQHPDLAEMVGAGMPIGEAWGEALARMRGETAVQPTDDMREFDFARQNGFEGSFADWVHPPEDNTPSLPTSYQEFLLSQQDPGYAASLASSSTRPPTEGERRNQQLASVIEPELATLEQNWDALTDPGNQMAGAEVGGNRPGLAFTSPEYQQAINSLSAIVASYLYSVSGATATDEEIKRQVNLLTPRLGESEASANAKKDRIRQYAEAVKFAAGRAAPSPGGSGGIGGTTSTGLSWSVGP